MIALKITDTKDFMTKLLARDAFDTFLFSEGSVTTFTTFTIDGTWHPEFFEEKETQPSPSGKDADKDQSRQLTWKRMRPVIYDIIKGKHAPIQMRIVLKLADYNVDSLLKRSELPYVKEQVSGLFLNLTYAREAVTATTGTSLKIFTLDKSLDHVWDDMVRKFFQSRGISAE